MVGTVLGLRCWFRSGLAEMFFKLLTQIAVCGIGSK